MTAPAALVRVALEAGQPVFDVVSDESAADVRIFRAIVHAWAIDPGDAYRIVAGPPVTAAAFADLVGRLLLIDNRIRTVFPGPGELQAWLREANIDPRFRGQSPLARLLSERDAAIADILSYFDEWIHGVARSGDHAESVRFGRVLSGHAA